MSGQRGGKPSAVVYRRRRLVALVLLIVLIALVVWGVTALVGAFTGGGNDASSTDDVAPTQTADSDASATPSETAEPTPTPTPTPTDDTPAVCSADEVTVTAVTDALSYAPDALPQLSMKLVNTSDTPCRMDVGTSAQVYTVKSGDDTIWTSTDCQTGETSQVVELTPGKEVTAPAIEWVRERSTPDTCDSDSRPDAVGGGAYYSLTVSIGGVASEAVFFELQ